MKSIEKTSNSVDVAITEALIELNTTSENVDIVIVEKGSKGFLGFGVKPYKVRVTLKETSSNVDLQFEVAKKSVKSAKSMKEAIVPMNEEPLMTERKTSIENPVGEELLVDEGSPADIEAFDTSPVKIATIVGEIKPEGESSNLNIKMKTDAELKAEEFLSKIISAMNIKCKIDTYTIDNRIVVNIAGPKLGILIGKRGETLDSLQYLTQIVVNRVSSQYYKISLDIENYRAKRDETLVKLANKLADKAVRTNHSVFLEPMNPYDRRIIHATLQDNEFVFTESEGKEPHRKVVIKLR